LPLGNLEILFYLFYMLGCGALSDGEVVCWVAVTGGAVL